MTEELIQLLIVLIRGEPIADPAEFMERMRHAALGWRAAHMFVEDSEAGCKG